MHFIDDRFKTVEAVRQTPELSGLAVYMADW